MHGPRATEDITSASSWLATRRHLFTSTMAVAGGAVGQLAGGPVAGAVAAGYAAATVWLALGVAARRRTERAFDAALDALSGHAADLRAGRHPGDVPPVARTFAPSDPVGRLTAQADAARRVALDLGAPIADLLDRLDADARGRVRTRQLAMAQAAGVRATAGLLAALPVFGAAVGYGVGADPVRMLLHTRLGAVCAVAAVVLQLGGMAWVARLGSGIGAAA
jgi:tight adherence protein B